MNGGEPRFSPFSADVCPKFGVTLLKVSDYTVSVGESLMEHPFSIEAPGGYKLFGVYHEGAPSARYAVVQVHGLGGDMGSFSQLTMARFFASRGIPVFRFNQYTDLAGGRQFHQTTISGHVEDTRLVMDYAVGMGFKEIVLIGHSLGAAVVITAADARTNGLILWDPAGAPAERIVDWESRDERLNLAYLDWRTRVILGEDWISDAKRFPDPFKRLGTLDMPVAIIAADDGGLIAQCERFRAAARPSAHYVTLKGCGHTFLEQGAIEQLQASSLGWLQSEIGA